MPKYMVDPLKLNLKANLMKISLLKRKSPLKKKNPHQSKTQIGKGKNALYTRVHLGTCVYPEQPFSV